MDGYELYISFQSLFGTKYTTWQCWCSQWWLCRTPDVWEQERRRVIATQAGCGLYVAGGHWGSKKRHVQVCVAGKDGVRIASVIKPMLILIPIFQVIFPLIIEVLLCNVWLPLRRWKVRLMQGGCRWREKRGSIKRYLPTIRGIWMAWLANSPSRSFWFSLFYTLAG